MHDEMKADIDKNGRCAGAHCSVMQLYDAPFSFSLNAFFFPFFLRFHFLCERSLRRDRGLGNRRQIHQKHLELCRLC